SSNCCRMAPRRSDWFLEGLFSIFFLGSAKNCKSNLKNPYGGRFRWFAEVSKRGVNSFVSELLPFIEEERALVILLPSWELIPRISYLIYLILLLPCY
ncbi:21785_t:CDS:2, partial [Gigaspora margarita]